MTKDIKVSIILPVYNVEKYLRECLESAINQTLDSIELIAVNDGSTDDSLKILEEYKKNYGIKIITQENKGLSEARNSGLREAKGEYVYFLDSDDYIDLDSMSYCYNKAKENKLDIINFDALSFKDDKNSKVNLDEDYDRSNMIDSDKVYKGEDYYNYLMRNNAYRQPVWLNMYRRKFLLENNLIFYPGLIHEDELFTKIAYLKCEKIMYISKQFFFRRVRANSIMTTNMSKNKVESLVIIVENIYDYYKDNQNTLMDETKNNIIKYLESLCSIALTRNLIMNGSNEEKVVLRNKIIKCIDKKIELKSTRLKIQITFPKLYDRLYKIRTYIKK
ncbi:MAG: glycosyltransferase [Paeniclostridium sordellii]|nr:glycosyltransferase [Paeniclostridium sordellii]